ncbi:DUF1642 domain-containing protein [Streptococcus intermedius]
MDRQDLKEGQEVYVKGRVIHTGDHLDIVLDKGSFIENAIILHHEKPVIPQFVADWIEEGKKTCRDVQDLFEFDFNSEEVKRWFLNYKPFDLIARAWLDGYEVEKEKRYKIYIKSTGQALFNDKGSLRFMYKVHADNTGFLFTKSELEEASLGWVFDCEGVEVQEVE